MNTWKKPAAILGAGALVFAFFGTALAVATGASDQGVTPTFHDGNITADGNGNNDAANCAADDAIETGDTGGSDTSTNGVTVIWTYDGTTKEFGFTATGGLVTIAYVKGGDGYNEYNYGAGVAWDSGMFAPDTNDDGNPQGLSHAVFCTGPGEEVTAAPSFEQSQEAETEAPSEVPTEAPSDVPTEAPSFEQSQAADTDAPSFEQTQAADTDAPSQPQTDTVGGKGRTSGPADGAWLLVVALGVLLASVVVLTPARVKNRS